METSYIYSSSRIKVVEQELLNEADIEHLLTSSRGADLMRVLRETYLAPYITNDESGNVFNALEQSIFETKKLLAEIAPEPTLLEFLWVRYDFQNLRVFLRMKKASLTMEEVSPFLSRMGKYTPESLFEYIQSNTLDRLEPEFKKTFEQAIKAMEEKGLATADQIIDAGYFALAKRLAEETKNQTIEKVITLQIDLHNLKTRLRTLQVERVNDNSWFIVGGSFGLSEIENKEQALAKLKTFGGEIFWKEAIDEYLSDRHSTLLDVRADDYVLKIVKEMDTDVFSLATLLAYFIKSQNMALVIQTIITGKESGQSEAIIRKRLRNIYV